MSVPQDFDLLDPSRRRLQELSPSTECASSCVQQSLVTPGSASEMQDANSTLVDTVPRRAHVERGAAVDVDDTPTIQLLVSDTLQPPTNPGRLDADASSGSLLRCRYLLEEEIGSGGCSVVFRARDLGSTPARDWPAQLVAIKLLRTEQRSSLWARARLTREYQQLQRLSHPGIVRVFDLNCEADVCFMSMEFIVGQTVRKWMQTPRDLSDVLKLMESCCTALAHAHSEGIVHGDLKPTNIMVTEEGTAKLIDFGSAPGASSDGAARLDPSVAATLVYASPQILAGKSAEPRDDVFSLACVAYVILTGGRHPFGGRPSLEDGRAKSAPTYLRAIPPRLFEVLKRALSAEPERRPASVQEFLRASTASAGADAQDAAMRAPSVAPAQAVPQLADRNRLIIVGDPIRRGGRLSRRTRLAGSLIVLATAIAAATLGLRAGTPRPVARAAESSSPISNLPSEQSAPEISPAAAVPVEAKVSPSASGSVSFEAPTVEATAAQSLVAITVKRSQSMSGAAAFMWRVKRGSARPGVDYAQGGPQVAKFVEGQAVRTLFIPLLHTGAQDMAGRTPRSFTVVLERTGGGPALGRFARVKVTIVPFPDQQPSGAYQFQVRADKK